MWMYPCCSQAGFSWTDERNSAKLRHKLQPTSASEGLAWDNCWISPMWSTISVISWEYHGDSVIFNMIILLLNGRMIQWWHDIMGISDLVDINIVGNTMVCNDMYDMMVIFSVWMSFEDNQGDTLGVPRSMWIQRWDLGFWHATNRLTIMKLQKHIKTYQKILRIKYRLVI